jgi:hypothetical protein
VIFLDSRYADATIFKAWDSRKAQYNLTCFRRFPDYTKRYFIYEWVENDRLDNLANRFLSNPTLWFKILDINPEIIDPTSISPGTQIRIPNA